MTDKVIIFHAKDYEQLDFRNFLITLRENMNVTQELLYTYLDVPARTYQSWEQGKRLPCPFVQRLIRKELERTFEGIDNLPF